LLGVFRLVADSIDEPSLIKRGSVIPKIGCFAGI